MDVQQVLETISLKEKSIKALVDIERPIVFDVGNLTIWDPAPISVPKGDGKREEYFKNLSRENVQVALNKLYQLETEVVDNEKVICLPEGATAMPRAKPIPKPKEPTKWERFAAKKGIKSNKSRDKLVWDDVTNKFVPRYGYKKRENDEVKEWCVELPDGADPNTYKPSKKIKRK